MDRRSFLAHGTIAAAASTMPSALLAETAAVPVRINLNEHIGALPHIWSECAGSDRAAITLRESWRHDLDRWKNETGLKRVRFHGILADELGVYTPYFLAPPNSPPNFQNIDRVYDGLIEHGVSPYVELSFMPKNLASGERTFGFYKGNVTPPTSLEAWGGFITQLVTHLADRYGMAELRKWPFEVWNEPDLSAFWAGNQAQYFDLYKATAVAIKGVDSQIKIGGPATSQTAWIPEFLGFCDTANAPLDFVATHIYAGDNQKRVFGEDLHLAQTAVIPEAVQRARAKIDATRFKQLPMWISEWSSDSPAMIAHVLSACLPHAHAMSQWVMSGTYEELGPYFNLLKDGEFGFSTIVEGIPLPAYNTYRLLHALGTTRLAASGPALASRRANGTMAALVWNLADVSQPPGLPGARAPRQPRGEAKRYAVELAGARPGATVRVRYVDQARGSPMPAFKAMGSPQYPTLAQIAQLRRAAEIAPPMTMQLDHDRRITLDLPPEGVALIELG